MSSTFERRPAPRNGNWKAHAFAVAALVLAMSLVLGAGRGGARQP